MAVKSESLRTVSYPDQVIEGNPRNETTRVY